MNVQPRLRWAPEEGLRGGQVTGSMHFLRHELVEEISQTCGWSASVRSARDLDRRIHDQSIAVGSLCQRPDSGCHQRHCTWHERNEMVADFLNAYLGQARRRAGGYRDHDRSKPEACRLDRRQRQKSDDDLRDPWPRRSFLRGKHNPEEISEGTIHGNSESQTLKQGRLGSRRLTQSSL